MPDCVNCAETIVACYPCVSALRAEVERLRSEAARHRLDMEKLLENMIAKDAENAALKRSELDSQRAASQQYAEGTANRLHEVHTKNLALEQENAEFRAKLNQISDICWHEQDGIMGFDSKSQYHLAVYAKIALITTMQKEGAK